MKILINNNGYVASPYITDANVEIEITDEQEQQIRQLPYGKAWKYVDGSFELVYLFMDDRLREVREYECFKLIDNKSQLWYNNLTVAQQTELNSWYQAWLDVTKTHVIPVKPEWLMK